MEQTFRKENINIVYSVQQTQDGFILAGYTGPDVSSSSSWLIKADKDGSELWNRTFGENIYSWAYSVRQTSDGDICLQVEWDRNGCRGPRRILMHYSLRPMVTVTSSGTGHLEDNSGMRLALFRRPEMEVMSCRMTNSYGGYWGDAWLIRTDKDVMRSGTGLITCHPLFIQMLPLSMKPQTWLHSCWCHCCKWFWQDAWLIKTDKNGNEQWNRTFGAKTRTTLLLSSNIRWRLCSCGLARCGAGARMHGSSRRMQKVMSSGTWRSGKIQCLFCGADCGRGYILAGDAFFLGLMTGMHGW